MLCIDYLQYFFVYRLDCDVYLLCYYWRWAAVDVEMMLWELFNHEILSLHIL